MDSLPEKLKDSKSCPPTQLGEPTLFYLLIIYTICSISQSELSLNVFIHLLTHSINTNSVNVGNVSNSGDTKINKIH